jgi:hypothetical protein
MVQTKRMQATLVALAMLAGLAGAALAAGAEEIRGFAQNLGIADTAHFTETLDSLERTGRLPDRYLTREAAIRLGWKPGHDLWAVAPGRSIGGDAFANRERQLPAGLRYREADLDYRGGPRGAKRLIIGSDGRRWVTVDHYQSFHLVPR